MENFGNRATLILAAGFLIVNLPRRPDPLALLPMAAAVPCIGGVQR
jgi:hypothetical protein